MDMKIQDTWSFYGRLLGEWEGEESQLGFKDGREDNVMLPSPEDGALVGLRKSGVTVELCCPSPLADGDNSGLSGWLG